MTINVGILVFNEVEVLDFAGPFEVFSVASRITSKQNPESHAEFNVFLVAEDLAPVRARGGLSVLPTWDFHGRHPSIDVLIVPGGVVTDVSENANVIRWVAEIAKRASVTASVCTGAFLLGKAGLLGRRATTHWEDIKDLKTMCPAVQVEEGPRWIDEGRVLTSAGVSAGIDMCLHLVARLRGESLALETARRMDYAWANSHE